MSILFHLQSDSYSLYGQLQIRTPFLTYHDPVYGIKIQYPSDWEKIQFDKNFIVGFVSTSRHDSGVLENVMISSIKLSSSDTSLNNFGNTRISALESQYPDFHLISSSPFITSTGSPLYKIKFTHTDDILTNHYNGNLVIERY